MAIVRYTLDPNNPPTLSPEELARLDAMTDEEITAAAMADPDNPPITDEEWDRGLFGRDVRLTRQALGLSQEAFAERVGLPLQTVEDWEMGRVHPNAVERALIRLLAKDPPAVLALLAAQEATPTSSAA